MVFINHLLSHKKAGFHLQQKILGKKVEQALPGRGFSPLQSMPVESKRACGAHGFYVGHRETAKQYARNDVQVADILDDVSDNETGSRFGQSRECKEMTEEMESADSLCSCLLRS